jgi:hypothetical protein
MHKLALAISTFVIFFSLAPMALAGSVPSGGLCPGGTSDCASGLTCSYGGICQNLSLPTSNSGVTLVNPLGSGTSIMSFLLSILNIITTTVGPVIVILMLVFVGFKFVTAQGEPGKITEARQMLLWTVVGALILLGAKVIAIGICQTTNALSTGGSVASCVF